MMWSEKYRPKDISEMIGNEEARTALLEWFAKWKKGTKPILIVGPPGIGKTTIASLISKKFDYDMISLNASDVRNKSNINDVLRPVLGNVSVLGTPMIFIDEVDGIHGRSDFGGVEALVAILKESTVPIILAANSDSSDKMKAIKKTVKTIYFKPIPPRLLRIFLESILKIEGTKLSPGSMIKVISESRGDIRSLINLCQAQVSGFEPPTEKIFENLDVEHGINAFFKANSPEEARIILYSMQIDPREKINAFYSSIITSNLSKDEMQRMLTIISEADMLYGKIFKTQEWRLLRYLDNILFNLYKINLPIRYTKYNLSWPLLNKIRWDGRNIKALLTILSKNTHVSRSTFSTFHLPYVLQCIKNKKLKLTLGENFDDVIQKEIELLK